jgi:segregation and condensation protein A
VEAGNINALTTHSNVIVETIQKKSVAYKLDKFEGPLDLLLQLIDQEKLPITEVAIGQITEQYLQALRTIEGGMHPEILADFLVMAARLLYLKSKALFPSLGVDAEEEGMTLENQLKLYQRFVEASKGVEKLFHRRRYSFARERLGGQAETVFAPPQHLKPERMRAIMLQVLKGLEPIVKIPKTVIKRTISLRDTIRRIEDFLRMQGSTRFGALLNGSQSRTEVVVTFLALLELVKQRTVVIEQEVMFGDLVITKQN